MDLQTLTAFFMWCAIFNGAILILATFFCMCAPDFVYRVQSKYFPMPRETFDVVIYSFIGLFKIVFIAFSLVPYLALLMVG